MPKAIWNGAVIAAAKTVQVVDGYTYFPQDSVAPGVLRRSSHHSVCGWKGEADYFDVVVNGRVNANAAWTYAAAKSAAKHIEGHIGFWNGVAVVAD